MARVKNRVVETTVRTKEVSRRLHNFLGADVGYLKETTGGQTYPNGWTLAENAALHELGEGNVPPRDFMRQGADRFEKDDRTIAKIITGLVEGRTTPTMASNGLGVLLQNHVRQALRTGKFAPLDPRTIQRKGSSKPLIDTGKLRQGVDVRTKD